MWKTGLMYKLKERVWIYQTEVSKLMKEIWYRLDGCVCPCSIHFFLKIAKFEAVSFFKFKSDIYKTSCFLAISQIS